jgi:hypothetical protein
VVAAIDLVVGREQPHGPAGTERGSPQYGVVGDRGQLACFYGVPRDIEALHRGEHRVPGRLVHRDAEPGVVVGGEIATGLGLLDPLAAVAHPSEDS